MRFSINIVFNKNMQCRREKGWSFANGDIQNHKVLNGSQYKIDCISKNNLLL